MNYIITPTHIGQIRAGDTIEIDGALYTVGRNDIKHDGFMGTTLRGDSYRLGTVPVRKVEFIKAYN